MVDPGAADGRARTPFAFRTNGWLHQPVVSVVVRRLALAVPLLFVVSSMSFLLMSLTPGDAARQILGVEGSQAQYLQLRHALGLDLPLYSQYGRWVGHAFHGDLGTSLYTGETVTTAIAAHLPVTLSLIGGALLLSVVIGVTIGVFSAVTGGPFGRVVDAFALLGFALPPFWIGAELILLFAVKVDWFPAVGYVSLTQSFTGWIRSLALPVVALALGGIAAIAKQTREAMLDSLHTEYIRMAWANGIPAHSIFFRHALKNAAVRVVTIMGVQAVGLLGGTVFVENVFALPGLGSEVVNASIQHDLPVVQGVAIYFTVVVVFVNLVIDVAYTLLNPKVRTR